MLCKSYQAGRGTYRDLEAKKGSEEGSVDRIERT